MQDIKKDKKAFLKSIFPMLDKWIINYPILSNNEVISWLYDMVEQFTDEGKKAEKFQFQTYAKYLQQYCTFYDCKDTTNLLKEDIDARNGRVKKYLKFLYEGEEEEIKKLGFRKRPNDVSIRNQIQGKIKSFYSNRGSNISYGLKARKSGENVNELYLDRPLIKIIQSKLESIQYRLINKCESQLGLRIGDVLHTITNGKYRIEKYKEHYFIRNFKTNKETVTINFLFFTQELSELLQSTYPEQDITTLDLSMLFMTRQNNRISQNDYLARLKEICKEQKLDGNIKTHGMRKYFTSQLAKVEVDDKFKWHLEGREPNYRDAVYDNNLKNIEYVYTEWLKVEKVICVDCIIVDKTSIEIVKLRKELASKEEQIQILIKQQAKFEAKQKEQDSILDFVKKRIKEQDL